MTDELICVYQLIEPDGMPGVAYCGQAGLQHCIAVCKERPGWTWMEIGELEHVQRPVAYE